MVIKSKRRTRWRGGHRRVSCER